ncbi:MAG: ABC transporter substrate-binding protein [Candidatus Methanoplasma sp.]|nr:ABC transporter substrate-binding protein [Candidatus Methanoplasma sp.]
MQKNALFAIAAVAVLAIAGIGAALAFSGGSGEGRFEGDITDGAGRTVKAPESLDRGIVTFGSNDPLRFVSYFNMNGYVKEVDKGDVTDPRNGRAYSYAYDYTGLPYHSDNAIANEDVERVGKMNPSLIVVQNGLYSSYRSNVDALAERTCVVVLYSVDAPFWDSSFKVSEAFADNLDMLGKVLGRQSRADELKSGIQGIIDGIRGDVSGRSSSDSVYVAGVTWMGSNSLDATFPTYAPLILVGGNNAYRGSGAARVTLTPEEVAMLDKDIVVIDPSSSDKIIGNNGSQAVLAHIYGVNEGSANKIKLYAVMPIVWDSHNYDCVLAGSYYLESILYGIGSHEDAVSKMNGVFDLFYGSDGKDVLSKMSAFFEGKSGANGVDLPLMHELKVVRDGGGYSLARA